MPPVLVYLRVSKEEQARQDKSSLAQQEQAVTSLAARLGGTFAAPPFVDPGVSGGTAEDRPAFMALVTYCRSHPQSPRAPGYILVLNDSRWGRFTNAEESTYWRVELEKRTGWVVRFAEADDTEDRTARMLLRTIHSAQASAYREQIKANAKRGAIGTASRDYWQNEAPLGYRRLAQEPGQPARVLLPGQRKAATERVTLTPGPDDERELVGWIFRTYADGGASLGTLTGELLDRWPSRRWSRTTVRAVLTNPAYAGDVVWCRRPHDRVERLEQAARAPEDWIVCRDAHPAIVSRGLWAAVQARLRDHALHVRTPRADYVLSGLIHCVHCDQPYLGAGGPKGPPADPERYRFYRDRGYDRRYADCPGPVGTLQRRIIEPLVLRQIGAVAGHPSFRGILVEAFDALVAHIESAGGPDHAIERERTRLEAERTRLVAAVGQGTILAEDAGTRLAQIRSRLAGLLDQRERQRFAGRRSDRLAEERDRLLTLAADFVGAAAQLRGMALRAQVAPWLERATVDKFTRTLSITIRQVPGLGLLTVLGGSPEPDSP